MEAYFQTGLGILVSVFLFLIGYRQTIGIRRERIKNVNTKLCFMLKTSVLIDKKIDLNGKR